MNNLMKYSNKNKLKNDKTKIIKIIERKKTKQ